MKCEFLPVTCDALCDLAPEDLSLHSSPTLLLSIYSSFFLRTFCYPQLILISGLLSFLLSVPGTFSVLSSNARSILGGLFLPALSQVASSCPKLSSIRSLYFNLFETNCHYPKLLYMSTCVCLFVVFLL